MGRHAQGMHIHGVGLCRRALVLGGFLQARSRAGRLHSPPRGCLSLLAPSPTLAPAPVPAPWDAVPAPGDARGDLPRQPASEPALVTAAVKGD